MMRLQVQWVKWIAFFTVIIGSGVSLLGYQLAVNTQEGELFLLEVEPDVTLQEVEDRMEALFGKEQLPSLLIEMPKREDLPIGWEVCASRSTGRYLGQPREYYREVHPKEKADIRYIINSLANKSVVTLAFIKGELESAGDRIDHLHPFRFLMTVFTDEELKVGIRNIRGKGWVWNQFVGGLKECLSTEASIGNLHEELLCHFSQTVGIKPDLVRSSINQHNWDQLVDLLIMHIPRKGDYDRYDCTVFGLEKSLFLPIGETP